MKQYKPYSRLEKKKSKKSLLPKKFFFLLGLLLVLLIIIFAVRFLTPYQAVHNDDEWAVSIAELPQEKGINYLVYGIIEDEEDRKIEDIFFLHLPEEGHSPHKIFIPGQSIFELQNNVVEEDKKAEKGINTLFTPTDFYNEGGAELLINQLSRFLEVPIHHYIEINYTVVPALVQDVDGITYNDSHLIAEDFFDYFIRDDEEEIPLDRGRRRAQAFNELVTYLTEEKSIFTSHRLLRLMYPYIESSLSWNEIQEVYTSFEPLFDPESMVLQLPGSWEEYYGGRFWEPDRAQASVLMENLGDKFTIPSELVTVEVLNGSGEPGVASSVAEKLEGEGFEVVNVDNADSFDYERSQVISRVADVEYAREVAILIGGTELVKEPVADYGAMVTVIVGENF